MVGKCSVPNFQFRASLSHVDGVALEYNDDDDQHFMETCVLKFHTSAFYLSNLLRCTASQAI